MNALKQKQGEHKRCPYKTKKRTYLWKKLDFDTLF